MGAPAGGWLLPTMSALLLAASHPPASVLPFALVGLVPMAVRVARLSAGPGGGSAAFRSGLLFGAVHHALLLWWIVPALGWATALAVPAFLAVVAILAAVGGGFGWTLHRAVHRAGAPLALALPVAWTAAEWARAHLPGGLAFPWLELGVALAPYPRLAGAAELVGTRGLSFWLAGVNGLLAGAVLAWVGRAGGEGAAGDAGPSRGPLLRLAGRPVAGRVAAAALLFAAPALWGVGRAASLETWPSLRVAVVQTSLARGSARDRSAALRAAVEAADTLLAPVPAGAVDLVVLPEGTIPFDLAAPEARSARDLLTRHAARIGAPVAVGTYGTGPGAGSWRNALAVVDPEGRPEAGYDKRRLVPLVERDALLWPALFDTGNAPRRPTSGAEDPTGVLELGGARLGVLVCWEAVFARDARARRAAGADVLLNPTNDAWYGDPAAGGGTLARAQHPAHLVLRAIETRAGAVRVANAGASAVVDPTGLVWLGPPEGDAGARIVEVRTSDVRTVFVRLGDLAGRGSIVLALLVAIGSARRPGSPLPEALSRLDRPSGPL